MKLTVFIFLSFVLNNLYGQCPEENIILLNAKDVSDYRINYSDCDHLEYDIQINTQEVSNLDFLKNVEDITGDVTIYEHQDKNISISYEVVSNIYEGRIDFLSNLTISNNGDKSLDNNWELYFSFSPGRAIDINRLPDDISITHIQGDFHKLTPLSNFTEIKPNESVTIPIISDLWAIKNTDVGNGFYFIFNNDNSAPYIPEFRIIPFTTKKQTTRTPDDDVAVPTSESRYTSNNRFDELPKDQLTKITPLPLLYNEEQNKSSDLTKFQTIYYTAGNQDFATYLSNKLESILNKKLKTAVITEKIPEGSIVIQRESPDFSSIVDVEQFFEEEGYALTIENNIIEIIGSTDSGIFYGIQSLISYVNSFENPIKIKELQVLDAPRFAYRGIHVDVARNFRSKEEIIKYIELMATYKINKLHFHITDDEGWRLEIEDLPELTKIGAFRGHTLDEKKHLYPELSSGPFASSKKNSGNGFYTKNDFSEILEVAAKNHIEVIPEIDLPGHARAAIVSMKNRYEYYLEKGEIDKANQYRLHDPEDESTYESVQRYNDNVVCVCQESTYTFIDKIFRELSDMYQQAQVPLKIIHIGGDEVASGAWIKSPICQEFIKKSPTINDAIDLEIYVTERILEIAATYNVQLYGWEEVGLRAIERHKEDEINSITINVWNQYNENQQDVAKLLLEANFPIILSTASYLYFDMSTNKTPTEPGYYWAGFVDEERIYSIDPYYFLTDDDKNDINLKNLKGIQGQIWSEVMTSNEIFEHMTVTKMISFSERAWSKDPKWKNDKALFEKDFNHFLNRMGQLELPKIDLKNDSFLYRIPPPGAIASNGTLKANTLFPGMDIRYTTDGTNPTIKSLKFNESIPFQKNVKFATFSKNGRKSDTINIQ